MQSLAEFISILLLIIITDSFSDEKTDLIIEGINDKVETAQKRLLELQTKLSELRQQLRHIETDKNSAPIFKPNVEQPKTPLPTVEKPLKDATKEDLERKSEERRMPGEAGKKSESEEKNLDKTVVNIKGLLNEWQMDDAKMWLGGNVKDMKREDLRKKISGLLWYIMWGVNDHINVALKLLKVKAAERTILEKFINEAEDFILKANYNAQNNRGTASYTNLCLTYMETIRKKYEKVVSMDDDVDHELTFTNRIIYMLQAAWNIIITDVPVAFRRTFLLKEEEEATKDMIAETQETILDIMAENDEVSLQETEMLANSLSELQGEWLLSRELEKRKTVPFRSYIDRQYRMRYFFDDSVYWDAAEKVCRALNGGLLGMKTPAKRLVEAVQKELNARMQNNEKIWLAKEDPDKDDYNSECYVLTGDGMQFEDGCIERQHGFVCWKAVEVDL